MIVLAPFLAFLAFAQIPPTEWDGVRMMAPGAQIRVIATTGKTVTGTFEDATAAAIQVSSPTGGRQTIDKVQIASVSVKKQGRRLRHTMIGMGAGLLFGVSVAIASRDSEIARDGISGGILWGAIIGVALPTGGWSKVYDSSHRERPSQVYKAP